MRTSRAPVRSKTTGETEHDTLRRTGSAFKGRRPRALIVLAIVMAASLVVASCATGEDQPVADQKPMHLSGTVSLWHHWSDREAKVWQHAIDGFEAKHPDVTVKVHSNQQDDKTARVLATGGDVDVLLVNAGDTLGTTCKAMTDLDPYMKRDSVSLSQFQKPFADMTGYKGRRCGLPTVADTHGLFYNTKLLKRAGYHHPPKTLAELKKMALKLTTYHRDGSIKTLGFDPLIGTAAVTPVTLSSATDAQFMKSNRAATDSKSWRRLMRWQKSLVDKIGYQKLKKFTAGLGDQYSANNPFQKEKVAMAVDGEYRAAFIKNQAPKLHYDTAPFPVAAGSGAHYGASAIAGPALGIRSGSKHQELAWALVKYLSTNKSASVQVANGLRNVPALKKAARSKGLKSSRQYDTFIDVARNEHSRPVPPTAIGSTLTDTLGEYWENYQAGSGRGLSNGLNKTTHDINERLRLREAK